MKILFVETLLSGHRVQYHKSLIESLGYDNSVLITPSFENDLKCTQVVNSSIDLRPRKILSYLKWIRFIISVCKKYDISHILFLDGDILYKFFGLYLRRLKEYKIIVTFHHLKDSFLHSYSFKSILKKINYGVVHTEHLKNRFKTIDNLVRINYPYFPKKLIDKYIDPADFFGLDKNKKTIISLGATRYDKGLDILIQSLNYTKTKNFQLLIVGKEDYFKKDFLMSLNKSSINVIYYMDNVSDSVWNLAIKNCDYLCLPYRKIFTGASGPLTEIVWNYKKVICSNCGSIGEIVTKNELGITFVAENPQSLAKSIDEMILNNEYNISKKYLDFRNSIDIEIFLKEYKKIFD